jgi:hypothetical protein
VPSAIASLLIGNTPELMLAYTSSLEWLVPWMQIPVWQDMPPRVWATPIWRGR